MKMVYFVGHKNLSESQKDFATLQLVGLIQYLIDRGDDRFTIGLNDDSDYLVANIISQFKKQYKHIFLQAIIQDTSVLNSKNEKRSKAFKCCNGIGILPKKFIIDKSDTIVFISDGQQSEDTYNTIKYAQSQGKRLIPICI